MQLFDLMNDLEFIFSRHCEPVSAQESFLLEKFIDVLHVNIVDPLPIGHLRALN